MILRIVRWSISLGILSFLVLGCGSSNILVDFGTVTDESLLFQAKQNMNDGLWSDALDNFDQMSVDFLTRRDVIYVHANAYAGRCGLNFMEFVESLGNIGSNTLFGFLMQTYTSATLTIADDCAQAEALIKSISDDPALRTANENVFMAFLGFTKIGAFLGAIADTDNDGSPDGGFDSCAGGSISDDQVKEVGTGLANALTSLSASGSSIGGDQVTDIDSMCTAINSNLGASYNFCEATNKDDVTADMIKGIRSIIGEGQALGIGSCAAVPNNLPNCACP
ncbi:MAG: hypothetical protein KDD61_10880 [Bdellovibrionales bacterium]|nr:hypothetical protein [Bdellovibrionales bacterium]